MKTKTSLIGLCAALVLFGCQSPTNDNGPKDISRANQAQIEAYVRALSLTSDAIVTDTEDEDNTDGLTVIVVNDDQAPEGKSGLIVTITYENYTVTVGEDTYTVTGSMNMYLLTDDLSDDITATFDCDIDITEGAKTTSVVLSLETTMTESLITQTGTIKINGAKFVIDTSVPMPPAPEV